MNKATALKIIPTLSDLRKDLKAKQKESARLTDEIVKLESTLEEIDGAIVHQDFPIFVDERADGGVEVLSACDNTSRNAFASRDSAEGETPERWRATGYADQGNAEGKVLGEGLSRKAAIAAAKDYVATGRVGKPKGEVKAARAPKAPKGEANGSASEAKPKKKKVAKATVVA
jgi:hypothetical protein